jgi:hypothetical protein
LSFSFLLILLATVLGSPDVYGQEPERESATAGALAKHLILFSIDLLHPEFYLDETWPAPTLQQMARWTSDGWSQHRQRVSVEVPETALVK